jgi:hypothetical protein
LRFGGLRSAAGCRKLARMPKRTILTKGEDYLLEDGEAPSLTDAGYLRMGQAHRLGDEVVIEVDEIVIFRYPAPIPTAQSLQEREREDAAAEASVYPDS